MVRALVTSLALLCIAGSSFAQCPGGNCGQSQFTRPAGMYGTPASYGGVVQINDLATPPTVRSNAVPKCQYAALVRVLFITPGDQEQEVGSGFIADRLGENAVVVTCAHGYKTLKRVRVDLQDGRQFDAAVIGVDAIKDICVCVIRDPGIAPLVMANDPPKAGEKLYMAGFPGGNRYLGTWGVANGWVSPSQAFKDTFLSTTCHVESGCSGGPILNERGEVVAIVTGSMMGGSTGPCLQKTLPEMQMAKLSYQTTAVTYQDSMFPWRNKMEKSQQRTNQELSQISGTLRAIQSAPPAMVPVPQAQPAAAACPDYSPVLNQMNNVLQQHGAAIAEMPKLVDKAVDEKLKPLNEKVDATAANIAKHGTLMERIAADKAQHPDESTLKAFLHAEVAKFKPGSDGDAKMDHKDTILIVVAGLGILLLIAGLVHYHRTGHGLVAEALIKAGKPGLAEKEEAFHDKIHGAIKSGMAAAGVATGNPLPAAGLAIDKIHDVKALLESLHAKMDNNTAVSAQAAQAATATATAAK